jgi:hypothetical protein
MSEDSDFGPALAAEYMAKSTPGILAKISDATPRDAHLYLIHAHLVQLAALVGPERAAALAHKLTNRITRVVE